MHPTFPQSSLKKNIQNLETSKEVVVCLVSMPNVLENCLIGSLVDFLDTMGIVIPFDLYLLTTMY